MDRVINLLTLVGGVLFTGSGFAVWLFGGIPDSPEQATIGTLCTLGQAIVFMIIGLTLLCYHWFLRRS